MDFEDIVLSEISQSLVTGGDKYCMIPLYMSNLKQSNLQKQKVEQRFPGNWGWGVVQWI